MSTFRSRRGARSFACHVGAPPDARPPARKKTCREESRHGTHECIRHGEGPNNVRAFVASILLAGSLAAADWKPLFNGRNLDGWEVIGDGQWTVMADGAVLGQRIGDLRKMPSQPDFKGWVDTQSWLYTKRNDFGEFDLHLE